MSSPRQTTSFLKARFEEVGIQLNHRHGQNFLIDQNLLSVLADEARIEATDVVLEVGTGTGALTALLAQRAAAVVTVEIDARLHQLASEELVDFDNVTMLHQDALKNKNTLDARVLEAIDARRAALPGSSFKLVANLPYSIATPVVSNLLSLPSPPASLTVTIQRELAERMVARPRTKDYSALSIWVQSQCHTEILRIMPPEAFWPRPKVYSAIVRLTSDPTKRARIVDVDFFHSFVRSLFFHRRKFLRSVIISAFKGRLEKSEVDQILGEQGHGETARAEELEVETMISLAEAVRRRLK